MEEVAIRIKPETKRILTSLKSERESFDELVVKLIDLTPSRNRRRQLPFSGN